MKYLSFFFIIPFLCFSQEMNCGDRPSKPKKGENETKREYKNSKKYLNYKEALKEWKYCVGPMGIADRIDKNLELNETKEVDVVTNTCGDKPDRPKRAKGESVDDYRKTSEHILYRKKLKEWKKCMSPINISPRVFDGIEKKETTTNPNIKENTKIINPCGERPNKPIRAEGLNHEEYKNTAEHILYRQKLKEWRSCNKKNN